MMKKNAWLGESKLLIGQSQWNGGDQQDPPGVSVTMHDRKHRDTPQKNGNLAFLVLIFWKCKFSDSMTSSPKSGSLKSGSRF
jgi:hypothetical protein